MTLATKAHKFENRCKGGGGVDIFFKVHTLAPGRRSPRIAAFQARDLLHQCGYFTEFCGSEKRHFPLVIVYINSTEATLALVPTAFDCFPLPRFDSFLSECTVRRLSSCLPVHMRGTCTHVPIVVCFEFKFPGIHRHGKPQFKPRPHI